jgi:beta-galactosidase
VSRQSFDDGWTVLLGDPDPTVPRNTAKTASSGGPSDLSLDEGGRLPLPERIAARLGEELLREFMGSAKSVQGTWDPVRIPDDWTTRTAPLPPTTTLTEGASAVVDPQVRGGYLPTGTAWYRKVFEVPSLWDGKRVRLDFDGVMRDAHVWVNGSFIGSHYSGYTGFSLDVTEFLRYGEEGRNVVLVRTDTSSTEGWWAEGGGIYRHVWIVATDPVHIARHGVAVITSALDGDRAALTISTEIDNDGVDQTEVVVEHVVTSPNGTTTSVPAQSAVVGVLGRSITTSLVEIAPAEPWSPSAPALHQLSTVVQVGGRVVDEETTVFGIRTVAYGPEGLLVNGELTPIRGACCHQDFAGVGIALPDRVHEHKIALLRELGCNAYRTAHHAPAPELLDACDRLGLLVLDENRRLETNAEGLADLAELIRRDRNHPSVFMWSLANEELIEGTVMSHRLLRRLVDVAHSLDPSRPTTTAAMFGKEDTDFMSIPDVAGFNYDGGASGRFRDRFPDAPVMATEDTSYVSARGIYEDDPARGLTSSHDEGGLLARAGTAGGIALDAGAAGGALGTEDSGLATTEANRLAHPYLGGVFVWTGFDYRGEAGPFGWPAVNAAFGIMDFCGFPKDVWHYWHSRWTRHPVVHVLPHWNWEGLEGQRLRAVVYSNCDEVELLVNGDLVAKQRVPQSGIVASAVTYEPGCLEVRGYCRGELVTSSSRETAGEPTALRLLTGTKTIATGRDVAVARVEVVDAHGRIVPTACHEVEFTCDNGGRILGTGNGSPADHVPAAEAGRAAFNGLALAIVEGPAEPGPFTLTVAGIGLAPASLALRAVRTARKAS